MRPLHKVLDEYVPIACDVCGRDLLEALYRENYKGLVAQVEVTDGASGVTTIESMYFACKGKCDKEMQERCRHEFKTSSGWKDLSDLVIPADLLRWIMATLNRLRSGKYKYADAAFEKEKQLIMALAQKVFREMTERERERVRTLMELPF
jgi:adenosyl cobinamide kinase/adenosyl cobinamide phosphate guanylyltransferase